MAKLSVISIIKLSELQRFKRLDAEYYQPEYLRYYAMLRKMGSIRLGDKEYSKVTDGIHASIDFDSKSGIRCLSAQSVKKGYFDLSANTFISKEQHEHNLKTSLRVGDVIISSVGTIGNCAVITESMLPSNADRHVGIIRTTNQLDPYYLCAFINSKYGQFQTTRESTGNVQQNLFIDKMTEIFVPILPDQAEINSIMRNATTLLNDSESKHAEAKSNLLQRLNYSDEISDELSYVSTFKQVKQVHRFDPEYYQPKYERIIQLMRKQASEVKRFDDVVTFSKGIEVGSEAYQKQGIPFVRVSNVNEAEIDFDNMQYVSNAVYDTFKEKHSPRYGELLVTKDATAGIAFVVREGSPKLISGGILRARMKTSDDPDYVALVINSPFVRLQIERALTGSIIVHWQPKQVKSTLLPFIDHIEEERLGEPARKANEMRTEAKRLFMKAVQLVELGIERSIESSN
jgi:restriction endonuclease S subunit